MIADSRFSLWIGEADGQKVMRFSCLEDMSIDEAECALLSAPFAELAELAGVSGEDLREFSGPLRNIFSNGWQSWCFAGELEAGERVSRSRIVPALNVYCDGPAAPEARGEVCSYFYTYVRAGEGMLFLASRGRPEKATPPVVFRVDRASLDFCVAFTAMGASFEKGEVVAELRLFYRRGFFAAKDALREAYAAYGHFDRLAFLGAPGAERLVPGGYESWYNHYTRIDDAVISRDLAAIGENDNFVNAYYLKRGKPTVFQIDDGWEAAVGQWEPDSRKFPRGMGAIASEIEAKGMIPGLWIAPLLVTRSSSTYRDHPEWLLRDERGSCVVAGYNPNWDGIFYCFDISLPEVEEELASLFDTIIEDWGYRYLKLDFLYAGFVSGSVAHPAIRRNAGAAYEHYDRLMRRLTSRVRDSRGRGVAYLGCGAPLESSFRHFPLMRVGADTKEKWEDPLLRDVVRHQGRPAAYTNLTHTLGRSLLDGTVFVNDPDVIFCRTSRMGLSEPEKELVALVNGALASQIMFSDDAHEFGEEREIAFTRRVVDCYDRIAGAEFGVQRLRPDVYCLFSRDDRFVGIANLSDRAFYGDGFADYAPVVDHSKRRRDDEISAMAYAPRSISLFERIDN
jgi:Alpha-galactosidase